MEELTLARDSAALLRTLATGGADAAASWSELVERHGAHLWGICWRITRERQLTEDACQEAWLQVRARAGQFRGHGVDADAAARGWLTQVAASCALLLLRRRQRARRHETVLHDGAEAPCADADADADADAAPTAAHLLVCGALAALRPHDRIPLQLHFLGGFNHRQLAATLGCTPLAARVRVHRAIGRLRRHLGRSGVVLGVAALAGQLRAADAAPALPGGAVRYWQGLSTSSLTPTLAAAGLTTGIATMTTISLTSAAAAALLVCAIAHAGYAAEPATVTSEPSAPQAPAISRALNSNHAANPGGATVTTAPDGTIVITTVNSYTIDNGHATPVNAGAKPAVKIEYHVDPDGNVTVTANGKPVQPVKVGTGPQRLIVNGQEIVIDGTGAAAPAR